MLEPCHHQRMRLIGSKSFGLLAATLLVAPAWLSTPSPAHACSIGDGVWETRPDSGGVLPVGSHVFIMGVFESESLIVDIDGQPATLTRDEGLAMRLYGASFHLEPPATEGATVTLRHCRSGDPASCDDAPTWAWRAVAPDVEAPAAATGLEVGIYDHTDIDTTGDSCSNGELLDTTIYIHADAEPGDPEGAPRQVVIDVASAADGRVIESRLLDLSPAAREIDTTISFVDGLVEQPLAESVCVRVTTLDLAGNVAATLESCEADNVAVDPVQEPDGNSFFVPDEPHWASFVDADGPLRESCACHTNNPGPGGLGVLLLAVLGLRRRRRVPTDVGHSL